MIYLFALLYHQLLLAGGVFLSLFPYDMSCEYGIGCVASPSAQGASPRVKRAVAF